MKLKNFSMRITEEQDKILEAKARAMGFIKKSDYVRTLIFIPMNLQDLIKEIHNKVMKNDRL